MKPKKRPTAPNQRRTLCKVRDGFCSTWIEHLLAGSIPPKLLGTISVSPGRMLAASIISLSSPRHVSASPTRMNFLLIVAFDFKVGVLFGCVR